MQTKMKEESFCFNQKDAASRMWKYLCKEYGEHDDALNKCREGDPDIYWDTYWEVQCLAGKWKILVQCSYKISKHRVNCRFDVLYK